MTAREVTVEGAALVAAVWMAGAVPLRAQEPPSPSAPSPPVFGVGVDVLAVDVSVVDEDGRPVVGLSTGDFTVEVDGRPRRLVSVEYVGRDLEPPVEAPQSAYFSTNEGTAPGRLVLLLVDRGNIGRGGGRLVLRAADRFLDTLGPADRVGLAFVPGPAFNVEFTADLTDVRRGLQGVVGQADRAGFRVPLSEAMALLKYNDRIRWEQFIELECGFYKIGQQVDACIQQVEAEAAQVMLAYRNRSLDSLRGLGSILGSLKGIEGPKTVILISEGLGAESFSEIRDLARSASEAEVTLFVVLVDTSSNDAEHVYADLATPEDRDAETQGLYDLAGLARGTVLRAMGSADGVFQRIARELRGYYLLGVEPETSDRDGKSHSVRVQVARPGVTVRARGLLSIPVEPPSAERELAAALRSPLVERGLLLRVATYALHAADAGKVRLVVAAEIGRASRPVSVGLAVAGRDGRVVTSRAESGIGGGDGPVVHFTTELVVAPETYDLRLAALDASGRRGSVRHPVKAALVSAGGLDLSDLVLAPKPEAGAAVRPAVDLEAGGGGLSTLLELGAPDPAVVGGAGVTMEISETEEGAPLLSVPAVLEEGGRSMLRVARVDFAGGLLPPGDYVARARVLAGGRPVGALTRPFHVIASGGAASTRAPLAGLLTETPPFARGDLLAPATLGHFLDLAAGLAPGRVGDDVAAAIAEARAGQPGAMVDRLGGGAREDGRVAFLRGVGLYARGNLPAALTQLQATLRLRSDFFPAAVFIGGCYAASGKDLDAIGAWQTALIGENGSPVLYGVLSDALLRVHEPAQAVEILTEGLDLFPEDDSLRRRLGLAEAAAGRVEDALPLLTAWVDAHPGDSTALFATLALLFDGFSREAAGGAGEEERQRLVRYARAYVEGKGPNREVVERWLRYLEEQPGS